MYTLGLPDRPYAEVGLVSASVRSVWSSSDRESFLALRAEAARRGCDGVIVIGPHDRVVVEGAEHQRGDDREVTAGARIVRRGSLGRHDETRSQYRGTCIVHL